MMDKETVKRFLKPNWKKVENNDRKIACVIGKISKEFWIRQCDFLLYFLKNF